MRATRREAKAVASAALSDPRVWAVRIEEIEVSVPEKFATNRRRPSLRSVAERNALAEQRMHLRRWVARPRDH
jgi:hypothetical protein